MARQRVQTLPLGEGTTLTDKDVRALNRLSIMDIDRVMAVVTDPHVYELATVLPDQQPGRPGRPRKHPTYMYMIFHALIMVYGSARKAEGAMLNEFYWGAIKSGVAGVLGIDAARRLGGQGMGRHEYNHAKRTWLALARARELGHLSPDAKTDFANPQRSTYLAGDGTVTASPIRGNTADKRNLRRQDTGADWYVEGGEDGDPKYGPKFVLLSVRSDDTNSRVIVGCRYQQPGKGYGGEAGLATRMVEDLARRAVGGVQGVVYDGALRGAHRDRLMKAGLVVVNKQHGDTPPTKLETVYPDTPRARPRELWAAGGDLCTPATVLTRTDQPRTLVPVKQHKLERRRNKDGTWRWYRAIHVDGGRPIRVRIDTTPNDRERGFNRAEHVRQIPPSTQDQPNPLFDTIYGWRPSAENLHSVLDRRFWNGRIPAYSPTSQRLVMLSFMMAENAMARQIHLRRQQARTRAPAIQIAA
ncbi:hypothetical protein CFN78_25625 [Amycolatopsis antarctica]|uniref:Transposase n=1 Tax=Amycolatopsis antarctica TaxID=1854586 RepID=A0A263CW42_9PSEU|nr:hypothetical protein [Amycolatopsis antarctica]OZM70311.1 hypothetical protein CFN78_25625 [Amycolatopsis antarctica]